MSFGKKFLTTIQVAILLVLGTATTLTLGWGTCRGVDYLRGVQPNSTLKDISKFFNDNHKGIKAVGKLAKGLNK